MKRTSMVLLILSCFMCSHLAVCPRYGAVVRGANAYIPPGARKHLQQNSSTGTGPSGNPPSKQEVPKVAVNGPDGSTVATPKEATPPTAKSTSPAPSTSSVNKVCLKDLTLFIMVYSLTTLA